jgi:undecaprenyl-diphosphatase
VQTILRAAVRKAGTFLGGLGIILVAGIVVAAIGTWLFGEFADIVMEGKTQRLDEAVLRWVQTHHTPALDEAMLEITALGTGVVVLMIVGISSLFLALTRHRYSALLLLVATGGGIILNNVLKMFFDRPRPQIFEWGEHASTSSFPSGHAMSATIAYATVAYLAARLAKKRWIRWITILGAAIVIALIALSRMYLGVHYPSDVMAGAIIGLAWAAFCMATLEAVQRFGGRSGREIRKVEQPAPEPETT